MAGGSSTSEASGVDTRTITTTSGYAALSSSTPTYASLRRDVLEAEVEERPGAELQVEPVAGDVELDA